MLGLDSVKFLFNDTTLKSFRNPMIFIGLNRLVRRWFGPPQRSLLTGRRYGRLVRIDSGSAASAALAASREE
jgi:hypothetical protein